MTSTNDDLPIVDPAESLRLIEQERANLARELIPDPRLMYWPWGFAWLLGFGALFLRYSPGGRVLVDLPEWLPLLILMVSLITAGIVTGVAGGRAGRQVAGPTSRQGFRYGLTWSVAFAGMSILFSRFGGLMPQDQLILLWGGGTVALTGALHMAGGAIWHDRNLFLLGLWTSAINIVGVICGPGWHALIVALGGGGGMILSGQVGWRRLR